MNSHILIPKCVLKKFVNDKQYYFKYDIITDKITKAYPKTTNTAPDYFSPKITEAINELVRKAKGNFCKVSVQLLLCNIVLKLKNASQVYDVM